MSHSGEARFDSQMQQAQVEVPLHPRKKAKHWQEIFRKYDLDNDGRISLTELRAMILSESYENDIPEHTVRMIMQKADEDQSGYLDMREFEKMYWMYIFEKYDIDRDGNISVKELKTLLRENGDDEIPHDIVVRLLNLGDKDQDNFLNFDEFHKLVHTKEFRSLMGHMVSAYIRSTIVPRKHARGPTGDVLDARGDYEDEYSCSPPSVCMLVISVIEIVTYMWDVITEGNHLGNGPAATIFIYDPLKRYEVWRYVTYMFVHVGVMHITVNLLVQVLLGTPLEMVHRWWRVLIIYFAGVLAGSLGTSISDPRVYLAGASGGVYALITAHVSSIVMNWSEMRFALLQLVVFFILTASDIGNAIYNRYILDDPNGEHHRMASREFRSLMGHMLNAYVHSVVVPRKASEYAAVDDVPMYEEEYSCRPPTFFMVIISLTEIIIYLCDVYTAEDGNEGVATRLFTYDPEKRKEIWRFISYMFVHNGVLHIVGNLLVQILLGIPLEMVHKWWRVLLIYFAGGLAGSLGTSITDPKTKLVGASGGVYALISAHIASIIMNWSEMRFAPLQLVVMFIWIGCDITIAVYKRYLPEARDSVGYVAHLAGALAGLLVGINVLRNLRVKKWENIVWWIAIVTYCSLMLGAIIWNIIS